ncbi:TetR/AcrR family transcriptional regulator [Amycolatopsis minnesotensis]|uniref:TetR/AcrR family transcriptional regulator n=2 Tax=Amycolatopsis minnesotensis TaxID=337894 RepID=A0ABN2QHC1_9PSEU
MSRDERRLQLLATAAEIIRADGTNSLTLVSLAERAGVSRPIAYDHFKSREGLLMALYREYDQRIGRAIRQALGDRPESVDAVVSVLSTAYIDGVLAAGAECDEVHAALSGSPETRDFLRESREFYVDEFHSALAPFVPLRRRADFAVLTGILGTVEGVAREAAAGRLSRAAAIAGSVTVVVGALRRHAELTASTRS